MISRRPSGEYHQLRALVLTPRGDAIPAPSDLAFEHSPDFDPFSVYREGDELVGVQAKQGLEAREADLRRVFGDYLPQSLGPRGSIASHGPASPSSQSPPSLATSASTRARGRMSSDGSFPEVPGLTHSPRSKYEASPRTPADGVALSTMPDLDLSVLGSLQELSLEEKLELGRKRHQEYLERTRAEAAAP